MISNYFWLVLQIFAHFLQFYYFLLIFYVIKIPKTDYFDPGSVRRC